MQPKQNTMKGSKKPIVPTLSEIAHKLDVNYGKPNQIDDLDVIQRLTHQLSDQLDRAYGRQEWIRFELKRIPGDGLLFTIETKKKE